MTKGIIICTLFRQTMGCRLDKMDTYPLTKLEQPENYAASKHEPETGEYAFKFEDRKEIAYIL